MDEYMDGWIVDQWNEHAIVLILVDMIYTYKEVDALK
jgi:hypothetical protein